MTETAKSCLLLKSRILLSPIFLFSGAMKIAHWDETASGMVAEGMVAVPFFLFMATLFELVGGLGMLLGWRTATSAVLLAAFLVPVTLVFHDFWTYDGPEMENQMQHFAKNLTIIGGLLALAGAGPGSYSVDACRCGRNNP